MKKNKDVILVKELAEIVPSWRDVDLTRLGYNEQWIETIGKLVEYVKRKVNEASK